MAGGIAGPTMECGALSDETKESYSLLLKTFDDNKFHCTQNVFSNLNNNYLVTKELLDTSWSFIGGIALLNRTCGCLPGVFWQ